jgi:hypothetical protein
MTVSNPKEISMGNLIPTPNLIHSRKNISVYPSSNQQEKVEFHFIGTKCPKNSLLSRHPSGAKIG